MYDELRKDKRDSSHRSSHTKKDVNQRRGNHLCVSCGLLCLPSGRSNSDPSDYKCSHRVLYSFRGPVISSNLSQTHFFEFYSLAIRSRMLGLAHVRLGLLLLTVIAISRCPEEAEGRAAMTVGPRSGKNWTSLHL